MRQPRRGLKIIMDKLQDKAMAGRAGLYRHRKGEQGVRQVPVRLGTKTPDLIRTKYLILGYFLLGKSRQTCDFCILILGLLE